MAVSVQQYNHTSYRNRAGFNNAIATYKLVLLSSTYTYDATDTVYADISSNELHGGSWDADGKTLTGVSLSAFNTNGSKFTADDITVTLSGVSIDNIKHAVLVNTTEDLLVLCYSFTPEITIQDGIPFYFVFSADGIMNDTPV